MTAALTLTALTGCGKLQDITRNASKKGGLEVSLDHSYASEQFETEGLGYVSGGVSLGDQILFGGYSDEGNQVFSSYDPASGTIKELTLDFLKNGDDGEYTYISSMIPRDDGTFCFFVNGYKELSDDPEDYSYEDLGMTIEIYDSNMNHIDSRTLSGDATNFSEVFAGPNHTYYATRWDDSGQMEFLVLNENFEKTGSINANIDYLENVITTKNGTIAVTYQSNEKGSLFGTIDPQNNTLNPVDIEGMPMWYNNCFASTDDAWDLYVYDSTGVYGINIADKKCEEVINWLNSDFLSDGINYVTQLSDKRFLVFENDYTSQDSKTEMWMLSPRDPAELKNVKLISMAALYMPSDLARAVNRYNRSQNEYRIAVVDYSKYNTEEDYEAGMTKLQNDMTAGIVADLICVDGVPYESFCNKGIFMDLSDRASGLTNDDYFTSFFDALRYGDKLYRIGFSYSVNTLMAKSSAVGGKSGISVKEFMDILNSLPKDAAAFEDLSRDSAVYMLITNNLNAFVDAGKGTCSFDSPEFIQLLEMCMSYPEESRDYANMSDSDWEKYWAEQAYQYINDKVLFRNIYMSDIRSTYNEQFQYFDDEPVTFVGYPTMQEGSNGGRFAPNFTVAISANTDYADQCWDFLSYMLSDEYQDSLNWSFPVKRSSFDKLAEASLKPETYMMEGSEVVADNTIYRGDEEVKLPQMEQSYIDNLKQYIESVTETNYYDQTIYNIVEEETSKMISGDQSAQQAAVMIQSRVSLYLSEQH